MEAYICDRCGKAFSLKSITRLKFYDGSTDTTRFEGRLYSDLCPDCVIKLAEWFNEYKEQTDGNSKVDD